MRLNVSPFGRCGIYMRPARPEWPARRGPPDAGQKAPARRIASVRPITSATSCTEAGSRNQPAGLWTGLSATPNAAAREIRFRRRYAAFLACSAFFAWSAQRTGGVPASALALALAQALAPRRQTSLARTLEKSQAAARSSGRRWRYP